MEEKINTSEAQDKEPVKQQNFLGVYEALKTDLSERLKWFKNQQDDFCIIDRINTFLFNTVFVDALYQYDPGVILCERLYRKDKCSFHKYEQDKFTEEQKNVFSEFLKFSDNLPAAENLTEKECEEVSIKLKGYEEKIKSAVPQKEEKDLIVYSDAGLGVTYLLTMLKDISDKSIEYASSIIANFVISYYQMMAYSIDPQSLKISGHEFEDYIDIVVSIE